MIISFGNLYARRGRQRNVILLCDHLIASGSRALSRVIFVRDTRIKDARDHRD